jgi:hypothetical protein
VRTTAGRKKAPSSIDSTLFDIFNEGLQSHFQKSHKQQQQKETPNLLRVCGGMVMYSCHSHPADLPNSHQQDKSRGKKRDYEKG